MRKVPLALAAVAVLGLTAVAAPSPAEAGWRGGGFFPGVAGGLIAGAVIGGIAYNAYAYWSGLRIWPGLRILWRRLCAGLLRRRIWLRRWIRASLLWRLLRRFLPRRS